MPTYDFGDMWTEFGKPSTLFVFTANSTINRSGALVMGAGIARAVRDRVEGVDKALGQAILSRGPGSFGFLVMDYARHRIGAFQVKAHYSEPASPVLIGEAAQKLRKWAEEHSDIIINMNFPGIGHGRLPVDVVLPILRNLPENVHIWRPNPAKARV